MHALTAPFLATVGLLALAGGLKLARPGATAQALRTQGLPSSHVVVRALGAAEVVVAAAAAAGLTAGAIALAVAFAGFAGFVLLAIVRGRPLSSCGCFGGVDVPPTRLHVAVTTVLAVVAGAVAVGGPAGLPALGDESAWLVLGTLGSALLIAGLCYAVLAELPRLVVAAPPAPAKGHDHPSTFTITTRSALQ